MTFATTLVVVLAVLAILGLPLWLVAWQSGRRDTIRNFIVAGAGVAMLAAFLEADSAHKVSQCFEAGNPSCVDSGALGMILVMTALYVVAAWMAAFSIWRG